MKRFLFHAIAILVSTCVFAQEAAPPVLGILLQQLAKTDDPATQLNFLRGINAALKGRRGLTAPPEWAALAPKLAKSDNAEIREIAQTLGTIFGSSDAFAAARQTAADPKGEPGARRKALDSLIAGKDNETPALLRKLIGEPGPLRGPALRGFAAYQEKDTIDSIMAVYSKLAPEEKRDALGTVASRPAWAKNFVWLLDGQQIPRGDFSVALVRQLRGFKEHDLDDALDRHFGKMAGTTTDKQPEIAEIKKWLAPDYIKVGNPVHGREVFNRTCALCHKLFDFGAEIAPELTGANRTDLDYLLQNIVDPNALIGADYQLTIIETKDGRVLAGMIRGEDANTLTVRTMTEQVVLPVGDVKTRTVSPGSLMPEGLLQAMPHEDARDLFLYLSSSKQVPLPEAK